MDGLFAYIDVMFAAEGGRHGTLRPSKLIFIGTFPLTMGFVSSYSYPGSNKRKCKRKVSASGHGRSTTYITVGDSVRGNFCEIYLLADRKVLAEQQIERESGA